jgi:tRNA pseudouridine38-40 synthase
MQKKCTTTARILLELCYRGGDFSGWQSQAHGKSVQDAVEKAIKAVCGEDVRVHGAGRTDAGVHAYAQCAHFDVPEGVRFREDEWPGILNANLPPGARVVASRQVPGDFHARFSATGKIYRYRMLTHPTMSPFEIGRAWHIPGIFDEALFRQTLLLFVGQHDFSSFCAGLSRRKRSPVRTIRRITFTREADMLTVEVEGNGFLYRMVRCLVGIGVRVARKKMAVQEVASALDDPKLDFPRCAAPPDGLYLASVQYGS